MRFLKSNEDGFYPGASVKIKDLSYSLILTETGLKHYLIKSDEDLTGTILVLDCSVPAESLGGVTPGVNNNAIVVTDSGKFVFTQTKYLKSL